MEKIKEAIDVGKTAAKVLLEGKKKMPEEVDIWQQEHPEGEKMLRDLTSPKVFSERWRVRNAFDPEKGVERFSRAIERRTRTRLLLKFISYTAAAVFAGVVGMLVFQQPTLSLKEPATSDYARVYLLREDGNRIYLNDTLSVDYAGARMNNRKEGLLVYNPTGEVSEMAEINTLIVPRKGEYQVVLSDQTEVWLNAESELSYPVRFNEQIRKVSLKGEAFFEVAHHTIPFVVEINGMAIEVLGTAFNVTAYGDEVVSRITLNEGKIRVKNDTNNYELQPGDQLSWDKDSQKTEITRVDPHLYCAWREGEFIFNNEKMEDVVRKLSRWYDVEFEINSEEVRNLTFNGSLFRYGTLEEVCYVLRQANAIDFVWGDVIEVVEKQ